MTTTQHQQDRGDTVRRLHRVVQARPSRDGDGVLIQRIAGADLNADFDPFLLLDEIRSVEGADYVGGFPPHPHRGFETVTYMLHGTMRHTDHLGNTGLLTDGGLQWMTAGRGVIHSEMPQQTDGLLHGFQLWLNLPAADKMIPARYADYPATALPQVEVPGGSVKLLLGQWQDLRSPVATGATAPLYLDLALQPGAALDVPLAPAQQAALYVYDGASDELASRQLGFYTGGSLLRVRAGPAGLRALLLAGTPLREPVYQHGPFVMNSPREIEQAIADYRAGRLTD